MFSFKDLSAVFSQRFNHSPFPLTPATLYEPCNYFLTIGGKRIRPILCLMGNELFDDIHEDAYHLAAAVELFHNFTLIHDDIMDAAALRRGMETIHSKYNQSTAILSGDVMMIQSYEELNKINGSYLQKILKIFNKTAKEVCEGQQFDMDFENQDEVTLEAYIEMITLKTSVLLAASLEMGAIIGGASEGNCRHLYEFGKNLGIAFQIQDDYLDAFGDPQKFGKEVGGDIRQNKKTFLLLHTLDVAPEQQKRELYQLMQGQTTEKVQKVLAIYKACGVDAWANTLKEQYLQKAMEHLEAIAVVSSRKKPLKELADFLIQRDV
ncbi:polyprenyl synthetase family protein [Sediminibacterium sp. TEGAF015]|uniref:polyprenyl synthetase family protein n=1 Tax=Sediminibacterium sp. TEGAF015 TaxID=575378 RepID=UPI002201BD4B|nr:polyprenyl synthetase family protein [Sediminibacterium sp. TEGAF015]BDQ11147.1 isoprenyl synthetase [Sediminibacterium sp. TEGAF015]